MSSPLLCPQCHRQPVFIGYQYCSRGCGAQAAATLPPSSVCDNCNKNPKHCDPVSGVVHTFCGKSCAVQSKAKASTLCDTCKQRPKYYDPSTGKVQPFCSKTCATQTATSPIVQQRTPTSALNIPHGICQIPGCNKPVHSSHSDFCAIRHRDVGRTMCLWCRQSPQYSGSAFCSTSCLNTAESQGPILLLIPRGHDSYKNVREQFVNSWREANTTCPSVHCIYKVVMPQVSRRTYESYRNSVEARGHFSAKGMSTGNQHRRWHGTWRDCQVGDRGKNILCPSKTCGVCNIIRTSYKTKKAAQNFAVLRYGIGIYTSSSSSNSDKYAKNGGTSSKTKAMFLNHVVVGQGSKLPTDHTTLTAPPPGYDSVLGEVGQKVGTDECIVYNDDAIRPAYLLTYDS